MRETRMIGQCLAVLVFGVLSLSGGAALAQSPPTVGADGIDHGPTGTFNLDYFGALASPGTHLHWLIGDIEKNHLDPAMGDIRVGRYPKAIRDLDYLLKRFVNHPVALQAMEAVTSLTSQPDAVIPYYQNALAVYPQYAFTQAQYGHYLLKIGRHREAVTPLKSAITIEPTMAVAHAWLAQAYTKLGEQQLARESTERAKQLGYDGNI